MDKQNHTPDDDGDQRDSPASERPKFSCRLGAPIQTVTPVGKPPSQVTGRPQSAQQEQASQAQAPQQGQSANLGVLPGPDGEPVAGEDAADEVDPNSFYAQVGGRETFQRIVDVFYDQVAEDPHFRAHYPEEDLGPARERLLMFLEQYLGRTQDVPEASRPPPAADAAHALPRRRRGSRHLVKVYEGRRGVR